MEERTVEGFPLSPPQAHLWRISGGADTWNVGARVAVSGTPDADALRAALARLVAREEVLRTRLQPLSSALVVQVIADDAAPPFATHAAADEAEARELFARLVATPFGSEDGASVRAALVRIGADAHELHVVTPAACGDAASLWNVVASLALELDGGPDENGNDDADDEPMQYADLAQWLQDMFESEEAPEGLGFWRRADLAARAAVRISFEGPREGDFRPATLPVPLDADALDALAGAEGPPVRALLYGAWQHLVELHAGDAAAPPSFVAPGRVYEGLEDALGLFQRTLPVEPELDLERSLVDNGGAIEAVLAAAEDWHELFELERLRGGKEPTFLPHAFEVLPTAPEVRGGGLGFRLVERAGSTDRFVLKLVWDAGTRRAGLVHDTSVIAPDDARVLAAQLGHLLERALVEPARPLSELDVVGDDERRRLVSELASGGAAPALGALAPEAILARAREHPHAPAVAAADGTLTYDELVRRASAVASRLRDEGIGRGDFVGIAMGRGVAWPVAMLGVQLAGAAYLPLPPNYPAERIGFMLADTGARVVLVDQGGAVHDGLTTVRVDRLEPAAEPADSRAGPDDPAYVIYTSGSTGKSQGGAELSHRGVGALDWCDWHLGAYGAWPRGKAPTSCSPVVRLRQPRSWESCGPPSAPAASGW